MRRFLLLCVLILLVVVSCSQETEVPPKEITITFDANGGTGAMMDLKTKENVLVKLRVNRFDREGYTFAGWNTKPDGSGVPYFNEATLKINTDLNLYAQWTEIPKLTVVYNGCGATEGEMEDQTVLQGIEAKIRENVYVKKDHKFLGWGTTETSGVVYKDKVSVTFQVSTTLYAVWEHNLTSVSFDSNGGKGTMPQQVLETNTETSLNPNRFTKEDMVFGFWNTKKDGSGTQYKDKSGLSTEDPVTLYVQWANPLQSSDVVWKSGEIYKVLSNVVIPERVSIEGSGTVTLLLCDGAILDVVQGIAVLDGQTLIVDTEGSGTGVLNARSVGTHKAAIGGNDGADGDCGTIIVKNGLVNASLGSGANEAAAIGAGQGGTKGTILISGGTVIADASCEGTGHGAGIGGSRYNGGVYIAVSGGAVVARSGEDGSGIGAGAGGNNLSIMISGGTINANGGSSDGAGIGGGIDAGEIRITDGVVVARGGYNAAGIGCSGGGASGSISIVGGSVDTYAGDAVMQNNPEGIGRGAAETYGVDDIVIVVDHSVHMRYSNDGISWTDYEDVGGKYMQTI